MLHRVRLSFTPYAVAPVTLAAAKPLWRTLTSDVDFSRPDTGERALQEAILLSEGLPRKEVRR